MSNKSEPWRSEDPVTRRAGACWSPAAQKSGSTPEWRIAASSLNRAVPCLLPKAHLLLVHLDLHGQLQVVGHALLRAGVVVGVVPVHSPRVELSFQHTAPRVLATCTHLLDVLAALDQAGHDSHLGLDGRAKLHTRSVLLGGASTTLAPLRQRLAVEPELALGLGALRSMGLPRHLNPPSRLATGRTALRIAGPCISPSA